VTGDCGTVIWDRYRPGPGRAGEPSSRLDVVLDNRPHALAEAVQAIEAAGADISSIMTLPSEGGFQGNGPPRPDDQPGASGLGARGSGIHRSGGLEKMIAPRGVTGIVMVWLLAAGLGFGCGRLNAQGREALIAQGQQLFADKGCYGCHTIGTAGTPIAPDLRRTAARYPEATPTRWLRDPSAQEPTRHMPNLQLSEAEASALAAYLASLR
jgi:mono/diheme cytochrome c family protein